jgi:hypothetical protein
MILADRRVRPTMVDAAVVACREFSRVSPPGWRALAFPRPAAPRLYRLDLSRFTNRQKNAEHLASDT